MNIPITQTKSLATRVRVVALWAISIAGVLILGTIAGMALIAYLTKDMKRDECTYEQRVSNPDCMQ
jgi:hypothetical protein